MKWLLVAILVGLVIGRRHLIGDLVRALRDAPKSFRQGKQQVDDPAAAAREIGPKR